MKMIYCTYNVSVSEEITKILATLEIENYQIFDNVLAQTTGSDPRLNTAVWPGYNNSLLLQLSEKFDAFIQLITAHNQKMEDENEKIHCFQWGVEKVA